MLTAIVFVILTSNVNAICFIIITINKRFVDQYGSHVSIPMMQCICNDEENKDLFENIDDSVSLEDRDYCQNRTCFIIVVFKEGVFPYFRERNMV